MHARRIILSIIALGLILSGCFSPSEIVKTSTFTAQYSMSLSKVERPEKASQRYGTQKVDTVSTNPKYKFFFEDDLLRILWIADSRNISFSAVNKTDHSIKVPWDEAAFVDHDGATHRVMHSGVKYNDREKPQAPSIIVRRGSIEDIVFPTDFVRWVEGTRYTAGRWLEESLLPDYEYQSKYTKGTYASYEDFSRTMQGYVGKTYQVLLPLQIEDVVNDYIFTFRVDGVIKKQDTSSYKI